MRRVFLIATVLGLTLGGCSGAPRIASVPLRSNAIEQSISNGRSKPVIAPSYLYFEYQGQNQYFEVYGRKESDKGRWKRKTDCQHRVRITFVGFNPQGSDYAAEALRPGASCTYTVTNRHGKQGTLEMYVSSD